VGPSRPRIIEVHIDVPIIIPSKELIDITKTKMSQPFPAEIWILVSSQLLAQRDRVHLLKTCRQLYNLLLPRFYKDIYINPYVNKLPSLVETLIRRSELALQVDALRLEAWEWDRSADVPSNPHQEDGKSTGSVDWEVLGPVFEVYTSDLDVDEKCTWENALGNRVEDAFVALMLPLLPNLRSLSLALNYQTPLFDRMLERATFSASGGDDTRNPFAADPAFSSLRDISLEWYDTEGGLPVARVLQFFKIPSLRTFRGFKITEGHGGDDDDGTAPVPEHLPSPGQGTVTEVELLHSNGFNGFRHLVAACSAHLRSFKYEHDTTNVDGQTFRPERLRRALLSNKETLQNLWLDWEDDDCAEYDAGMAEVGEEERFTSFAEFTELRHLRLRVQSFLRDEEEEELLHVGSDSESGDESSEEGFSLRDFFPTSLETLYITGALTDRLSELTSLLQDLVASHRANIPQLRRIDIQGPEFNSFRGMANEIPKDILSIYPGRLPEEYVKPEIYEQTDPLRLVCEAVGIEFTIRSAPFEIAIALKNRVLQPGWDF
jgi:hypothetical protein